MVCLLFNLRHICEIALRHYFIAVLSSDLLQYDEKASVSEIAWYVINIYYNLLTVFHAFYTLVYCFNVANMLITNQ